MSEPEMFTTDEILLAADRFLIVNDRAAGAATMRLADDFNAQGKHLSSITDCLKYADTAFERGLKVSIGVHHEPRRVPPTPSP